MNTKIKLESFFSTAHPGWKACRRVLCMVACLFFTGCMNLSYDYQAHQEPNYPEEVRKILNAQKGKQFGLYQDYLYARFGPPSRILPDQNRDGGKIIFFEKQELDGSYSSSFYQGTGGGYGYINSETSRLMYYVDKDGYIYDWNYAYSSQELLGKLFGLYSYFYHANYAPICNFVKLENIGLSIGDYFDTTKAEEITNTSAFWLKNIGRANPSAYMAGNTENKKIILYKIKPLKSIWPFTHYFVSITPKTNRIFQIIAYSDAVAKDSQEGRILSADIDNKVRKIEQDGGCKTGDHDWPNLYTGWKSGTNMRADFRWLSANGRLVSSCAIWDTELAKQK
jgi:hypothetical protein